MELDNHDLGIDEGLVIEHEISQTTTETEDKILVEKQIIKVVKEEEEVPLVASDRDKCCTHCYLVVVKGLVTIFVIPALIIASIVAWAIWLVLLPVTCCCPCCEICTTIVKFIWKFLSTVPVYLSDWVCNKESDDDRYQMARKKKRNKGKKKSRKRKSYSSMETQTALDDIESNDTTIDGDLLADHGIYNEGNTGDYYETAKGNSIDAPPAKRVSFLEDDVMLLDDGLGDGGHGEDVLLDCGVPMQGMGQKYASSGTYSGSNIARDLENQVEEAYMSCTDNDLTTSSESEEDLMYIE